MSFLIPASTRWRVVALLTAFSIVGYILRTSITIAGEPIMHEFGFSQVRLGWIFSAFLVTYTVFNLPSGAWADRWGSRRVLAAAGLSWFVLTLLTALLPGNVFTSYGSALGAFLVLRLVFGIGEAPMFGCATKAIANWLPMSERALANGVVIAGGLLGSTFVGPAFFVADGPYRLARRHGCEFSRGAVARCPLVGVLPGPSLGAGPCQRGGTQSHRRCDCSQ